MGHNAFVRPANIPFDPHLVSLAGGGLLTSEGVTEKRDDVFLLQASSSTRRPATELR